MCTSSVSVGIIIIGVMMQVHFGQNSGLGVFRESADIGEVRIPGSVQYDGDEQVYTLSGSGKNMWFDSDQFRYVFRELQGDFILRAQVDFIGEGVDPHRKLGWIVRNTLDTSAVHVNAALHGDGLTSLQYRDQTGGMTQERKLNLQHPQVIQLRRSGDRFTFSAAAFGQPFVSEHISGITLNDTVYAGIYVCSHNPDVLEKAVFRNVRIILPAEKDFRPYQDYIGSNLEIMDVATGHRRIVYRDAGSIQAPNWTPDGSALIYNSKGRLYRFDLKSGSAEPVETDFAVNNNNDHVISFDGRQMGISHHSTDHEGKSIIYTLPIEGGTPVQITPNGPSYLHGWSPDGEYLVYTGERNGQFDIYKISVGDKREIQLTDTKGLDDGSEYTPDGAFIYFNSNRTGTMQIWRMKTDGSAQEQVTFDEYNDWFPHISPDGRNMVFLSYMPAVPSGDHPFYKQVFIRRMPVEGGQPEIIAYLYGGQGTINVPSWSPDGTYIAFVSNTRMD